MVAPKAIPRAAIQAYVTGGRAGPAGVVSDAYAPAQNGSAGELVQR